MALHKPRHPHTLAMQTQTSWDPIKEHWATSCLKTLVPAHIDPNPASSCSLRFPDHLPLRCSWEMEEETWSRQRDHPGAPSRPEEAAFDRELTPVEWLTPSPCAWQLSQEARPHNEAASGWDPGCRDLFAPMGSRKSSRPMSSPSPKGLELSAHDYAIHTLFQPENESFIAQARWVLTSNLICRSWICIWALRSNCICKWFCFQRCAYQEEFISFLKEVTMLGGGFGLLDLFPSIKLLRYTSRMKPAWERLHPKIDVILNHIIADYKAKLEGAVDAESKPPRYLKSYRQKLHFLKIDPTQLPLGIWRRKSSQLELTHPRRQLSGRRRRCCGTQGWCWRASRRSGATSTGKPESRSPTWSPRVHQGGGQGNPEAPPAGPANGDGSKREMQGDGLRHPLKDQDHHQHMGHRPRPGLPNQPGWIPTREVPGVVGGLQREQSRVHSLRRREGDLPRD